MFKGIYWLLVLDCNPDKKIFVEKINRWYQLGIRETLFEKKAELKKNLFRFKTFNSTTYFRRKQRRTTQVKHQNQHCIMKSNVYVYSINMRQFHYDFMKITIR